MCKEGEPCVGNDDHKKSNDDFMGRIEMLIVMSELYEAEGVKIPHAAGAMIDVVGPLMMETMRVAKGWGHIQMASALIKQKNKMHTDAGLPVPHNALAEIVQMLADLEAKKNGAKNGEG